MRILEIRHVTIGPGIQRIDDHFPVHGTGDLDMSLLEVGRHRIDGPTAFADGSGFLEKIRHPAAVDCGLTLFAGGKEFEPARIELTVEFREKVEGVGREDFLMPARDFSLDFEICGDHGIK
jgi:hypothetical protein